MNKEIVPQGPDPEFIVFIIGYLLVMSIVAALVVVICGGFWEVLLLAG